MRPAIVGPFVWLMLLEQMLLKLGDYGWALPGQAGSALALDLAPTRSGGTLLAYAVIGTALAVVATQRRDVSS